MLIDPPSHQQNLHVLQYTAAQRIASFLFSKQLIFKKSDYRSLEAIATSSTMALQFTRVSAGFIYF